MSASLRIEPSDARKKLGDSSLKAFDAHAHSYFSHDIKERQAYDPITLFFNGLDRGMDFVAITDHDEYGQNEFVEERLRDRPALLKRYVPGTEFTVSDKDLGHTIHVNVFMHTRRDFEKLKLLRSDIVAFVRYCVRRKLPYQYNHPIWFELSEHLGIDEKRFEAILKYARIFPVIEASNSNRPIHENQAGEFLAKILNKGVTSASDGHFGDLGARGYTLAQGKNFRDFWNNVIKGKSHLVKRNLQLEDMRQYVVETIDHLAYPTKIKRTGRYSIDTGNMTVGKMITVFDRFPFLLRVLKPYLVGKVRRSKSISRYIDSQNRLGERALEYFKIHAVSKVPSVFVPVSYEV